MRPLLLVVAMLLLSLVAGVLLIWKFYRRIGPHEALVVNGPLGLRVRLRQGALVLPFFYRAEVVDLSTRTMELTLEGAQSLYCRDSLRADVRARFVLRIAPNVADVEKVMLTLGAARAGSPEVLRELFEARFREALRTVCRAMDFDDWLQRQSEFRDEVLKWLGRDLSGFTLDDVHLDAFAATPLSLYDSSNILDAQGIRRITERINQEYVARAREESEARMEVLRLQAEADAAVEKAQADGRAASGDGGGSGGTDAAGFQAGLRKM